MTRLLAAGRLDAAADDGGATVTTPVQLSYTLHTPLSQLRPEVVFGTGERIVGLLDRIQAAAQRERLPRRAEWRLADEGKRTVILRPISEPDLAELAAIVAVRGFSLAEQESRLDPAWDTRVADSARRIADALGDTATTGLTLVATGTDGSTDALVTRRAGGHLREAAQAGMTSFGSVMGVLGGAWSRPRRRASMWSDLDGRRIEVRFGPQHDEDIRGAWAREHVEVTGMLYENVAGQILRIDLESLQVHDDDGPSFADLPWGFYPEMTEGLGTAAYLKAIRGEE